MVRARRMTQKPLPATRPSNTAKLRTGHTHGRTFMLYTFYRELSARNTCSGAGGGENNAPQLRLSCFSAAPQLKGCNGLPASEPGSRCQRRERLSRDIFWVYAGRRLGGRVPEQFPGET